MTIGGLWPALQYVSWPSAADDAEHQRDEPRFEAPAAQRLVHVGDRRGGTVRQQHVRREHALHEGAHERGRRPLARDVAEREPERRTGIVEVVEEVAPDRSARDAGRGGLDEPQAGPRLRQQRLLDLGGDPHFLIHAALLELLAVQPGVLDRHGRLGRERLEAGPRGIGEQRALLAAIEVQHADAAIFGAGLGRFDVVHVVQRHADDMTDAERDGAHVHVREPAVEQIRDDLRLADAKDLLGNLAARRERAVGERLLVLAAGELEFETGLGRQHDERALGAGDFNRRVEDEREHFLEHAAGSERPEALEQRRNLA